MRFLFIVLLFCNTLYAQRPTPAPAQSGAILIIGATAHIGNGQVIANSAVAFENGKITLVADATTIRIDRSRYAKIFDASGKHLYPGFIAPNTTLGLVEVDAVRSTQDYAETGAYNPNIRAIIAYNTDSEVIPTVRSNGILMAQVSPQGGVLSGASSVVQLDAWNYEDAALKLEDGIQLNWPYQRFGGEEGNPNKKDERYDKAVQDLHRFFSEAKAYLQDGKAEARNQKFEAMRGLFARSQRLYLHADNARAIQEAVLFAEQYNLIPVVVGGNDAWMLTAFLKQHHVPVVINPTQRLPAREDEDIDQPYKTAAALHEAGIMFAFSGSGSWRQRNLPFIAGQAVGYGLPYEAAISALSLNTATILGIDAKTGSLETGKDATLFLSEGDALDMQSSQVTAAFIQGREINLDNKQKQLARQFQEKYRQ